MIYTHSLPIFGEIDFETRRFLPKLPPPCWCGAREELQPDGRWVIRHDMHKHGLDTPVSKRLSTEALMDLADAKVLDRIGDRREA